MSPLRTISLISDFNDEREPPLRLATIIASVNIALIIVTEIATSADLLPVLLRLPKEPPFRIILVVVKVDIFNFAGSICEP